MPTACMGPSALFLLHNVPLLVCCNLQILRFILLGSVAAGGVFAYALFNSDLKQQPALGTGPVRGWTRADNAVIALSMVLGGMALHGAAHAESAS